MRRHLSSLVLKQVLKFAVLKPVMRGFPKNQPIRASGKPCRNYIFSIEVFQNIRF
jgi:hypothetical protein